MLRISATQLESFRLFSDPDQDWMTPEMLEASIRGIVTPTFEMQCGKAFDDILTDPEPYRVAEGYRSGEFFFHELTMNHALAIVDRRGVCQVKDTKRYGDAVVVAVADQLVGTELIENKTTWGPFAFDKYAESCQWRFMADIFQPSKITYRVFCLGEDGGNTALKNIETFSVYPYAGLHDDCCDLVRQFVDYATVTGLDTVLRERYARSEAA